METMRRTEMTKWGSCGRRRNIGIRDTGQSGAGTVNFRRRPLSRRFRFSFQFPAFLLLLSLSNPVSARIGYGVATVDDASVLWRGVWEVGLGAELGGGYPLNGTKIDLRKVPTSIRYGWKDRLEFGLEVPFAIQRSDDVRYDGSGLSDVKGSIKYQMSENVGGTPASATELIIGNGPNDVVASGALSVGINYSLSRRFGPRGVGHMNLGYTFFSGNRPDVFKWGAAFEYRLLRKLRGTISAVSGGQEIPGVKNDIVVEGGLAGEVTPTLEYYISGGAGLNSSSPSWQFRLGLKKEFGRDAGVATRYGRAQWARPPAPPPEADVARAEDAMRVGDYSEAIRLYRQALSRDSSIVSAWNNLGNAYFNVGKTQQALKAYEKASTLDPTNADIFFNMGLVYYKHGDLWEARRAFAQAVKLDPNHERAKKNLMLLGEIEEK